MKEKIKSGVTTQKQYELFKSECAYWQKRFGLLDWEFSYRHGGADEYARADILIKYDAKIATISLSDDWGEEEPLTDGLVAKTAFHEVDEVRYAWIRRLMETFSADSISDSAVHGLIRTDENVIWEEYWQRKRK
jgi:hypothetical protein